MLIKTTTKIVIHYGRKLEDRFTLTANDVRIDGDSKEFTIKGKFIAEKKSK